MWWLLLSLGSLGAGGEIFGEIKFGDDYVSNADVKVVCGKETTAGKTDSTGSFRLRAQSTGKCVFSVSYKNQSPTIDVVVFERPTRYRLVIEEKDGKVVLRRV